MTSRIFAPATSGSVDEVSYSPKSLSRPFFKMMNRIFSALHTNRHHFIHALYVLEKSANGEVHSSQVIGSVMDALIGCGLVTKAQRVGSADGHTFLTPEGQLFFTSVYTPYKHRWYTNLLSDYPQSFSDPDLSEISFPTFAPM